MASSREFEGTFLTHQTFKKGKQKHKNSTLSYCKNVQYTVFTNLYGHPSLLSLSVLSTATANRYMKSSTKSPQKNTCNSIGLSEQISDCNCGTVIGCQLWNKSVYKVSDLPWAIAITVNQMSLGETKACFFFTQLTMQTSQEASNQVLLALQKVVPSTIDRNLENLL